MYLMRPSRLLFCGGVRRASEGNVRGAIVPYPSSDARRRRPVRWRSCLAVLPAAMAVSVTTACTGSSAPPAVSGTATGAASVMTVAADKPSYQPGDPILLTATVTSREQHACLVAGVPDGVVTILSITHDGTPVVPTVGDAEYVGGFDDLISGNTASVAPGKSVAIQLSSETAGDPARPWWLIAGALVAVVVVREAQICAAGVAAGLGCGRCRCGRCRGRRFPRRLPLWRGRRSRAGACRCDCETSWGRYSRMLISSGCSARGAGRGSLRHC